MRSFFALVEQVAPYIMEKPYLHPFREFLKKDQKFYWDDNLQKIFNDIKVQLIDSIKDGLTRFKVNRDMALMTDKSKMGIGFILMGQIPIQSSVWSQLTLLVAQLLMISTLETVLPVLVVISIQFTKQVPFNVIASALTLVISSLVDQH